MFSFSYVRTQGEVGSLLPRIEPSPEPSHAGNDYLVTSLLHPISPGKIEVLEPKMEKNLKKNIYIYMAPLVAQMVKNLPTMQETQVKSLSHELSNCGDCRQKEKTAEDEMVR